MRLVRGLAVIVFAVVGTLTLVIGGFSAWLMYQVDDQGHFVAAADRTLEQSRFQQALNDRAASSIMDTINPSGRIDQWVEELIDGGIDPILAGVLIHAGGDFEERLDPAVRDLLRAGIETEEFRTAWLLAAEHAHAPLLDYLNGRTDTIIGSDDGALVFRLEVALGEIDMPDQLGFLLPSIPIDGYSVEIASADTMGKAQDSYQSVSSAATWLPWAGLLLIGAAVVLARRRISLLISVVAVMVVMAGLVYVLDRFAPHVLVAFAVQYGRYLPL